MSSGCLQPPCWDTTVYAELLKAKLGREYNILLGAMGRVRSSLVGGALLGSPWAGEHC